MLLSSFFQLLSFIYQVQHNKQKKSIYGLSFDYIVLSWAYYLTSIITTTNYYINPIIIKQFESRFPIYPTIYVSGPILLVDILSFIVVCGILLQLLYIYPHTRNINQSISGLNQLYLISFSLTLLLILKCCIFKQSALSTLDIIDFLWFFAKVTDCIKMIPQVTMNWFGSCVVGLSDRFLLTQWLSMSFLVLAKLSIHYGKLPYFEIPVNYNTWCYMIIVSSTLCLVTIQKKKLYRGASPTLATKYVENNDNNESV